MKTFKRQNNQQLVLTRKPGSEFPQEVNCFGIVNRPINSEDLAEGEMIVKVLYVSIDPVMRVWVTGATTYFPALKPNDAMHCFGIGYVVSSRSENFREGEVVFGNTSVAQYQVIDKQRQKTLQSLPEIQGFTNANYVTILNNGMAAYFGIDLCNLKPNETVVISTAAGATGVFACQIAKMKGARVVGITGSKEKCDFLQQTLKLDAVINYNDKEYFKQLKAACPKGIDAYFDNVGEEQLDNVLRIMNDFGRVALCGAISAYNDYKNRRGLQNYFNLISRRISIRGFTFSEFYDRYGEALNYFSEGIVQNKLVLKEEIFEGLENYSKAVKHLFSGKNIGKVLVKVALDEKEST